MDQGGGRSLLKWCGIGCGMMVLAVVGCAIVATAAYRAAVPDLPEVDVSGDCPEDGVRAYFEGRGARIEPLMTALDDAVGERSTDGSASAEGSGLQAEVVDLDALRAARGRIEATDVPECARGALAAEVGLFDMAIDVIEERRACAGSPSSCGAAVGWALATELPARVRHLQETAQALGMRAGIDTTEYDRAFEERIEDRRGRVRIDIEP